MKTQEKRLPAKSRIEENKLCKFSVSFSMPKKELVKQRRKQQEVYMEFPIGECAILPDYKNNLEELLKVEKMIEELENDENAEIIEISIENYTYPNGSFVLNQEISMKRAFGLKKYIQFLYGLEDNLFKIKGKSDDWARLEELLIESDMVGKEEALFIIWNTGIFEGRENALKSLDNGKIYEYIQKNFFPLLNRFKCIITYTILPFDTEKGRQILRINPEQLSLDELYQIARTYKSYTPTYNEIMGLALRLFPDSKIAIFNAGALALKFRNVKLAEKYLGCAVSNTPEYFNNKGILYALKGDYKKAWLAFKKAVDKGSNESEYNIMLMEKDKICF